MVEDNREDESVRKPADTFCNWKEVVEEDINKGPDNVNLEHEHSAHHQSDQRQGMDNGRWAFLLFFYFLCYALYDNRCTITTIKEIQHSLNDEQVKVVKELGFRELVKVKLFEIPKDIVSWCLNIHRKIVFVNEKDMESVLGINSGNVDIIEALVKQNCDSELERELGLEIEHGMIVKRNRENKVSLIRCMYVLAILYMKHFYPVGERILLETFRNLTRVLNWNKNRLLSRVIALQGIGPFRGKDVPIVDVEELCMDVCLEGVHKRLDLLDQNMKQLRGGLEGVLEEVPCIGESVEVANRSVMELVMNMITLLKKGQEDKLRDIRDDIREEEGRRQKNQIFNDDQLGGDVNDEIGVVGNKMAEWEIKNEEEKETRNKEFVGYDNEYNDMKIDKDGFSDRNDKLSKGEIGGEDDDLLNPQSSESSREFNRAGVARIPTAHENDRKQAVVTEVETCKWKGRTRGTAERASGKQLISLYDKLENQKRVRRERL
ncbi:hypothetical protein M9H77_19456 [Catharanthus roseus]|uniref:Uncharacterized protein n=1 Tax=Catharanthus roseus TaxID=4058 RepID=A0ACC0BAF1_CATRO|nr:hypothetical protein M9H77_19456 [Catharanthus roseus]